MSFSSNSQKAVFASAFTTPIARTHRWSLWCGVRSAVEEKNHIRRSLEGFQPAKLPASIEKPSIGSQLDQ
jgi:hypothetical protein